jgi:uncharacterized membrane protein
MRTKAENKVKSVAIVIFSFLTVIFYQNCSKPVSQSSMLASDLTEQDIVQEKAMSTLTSKCSKCHNTDLPTGGIDVMNIDEMLASGAIIPNEPSLSPLFEAITSGRMPPSKPLSQEDIESISHWITAYGSEDTGITLPPGQAIPLGPTYKSIYRNILVRNCIKCHSSNKSDGGLSFSTYAATMNSVQRTFPNSSTLYTSVAVRNTMPKSAPGSLTTEERKAIFDWIAAGALDN